MFLLEMSGILSTWAGSVEFFKEIWTQSAEVQDRRLNCQSHARNVLVFHVTKSFPNYVHACIETIIVSSSMLLSPRFLTQKERIRINLFRSKALLRTIYRSEVTAVFLFLISYREHQKTVVAIRNVCSEDYNH